MMGFLVCVPVRVFHGSASDVMIVVQPWLRPGLLSALNHKFNGNNRIGEIK
jgi:hypothetical protein